MSFESIRNIKSTRKAHCCWWCGKKIEQGSSAFYHAWEWDGDFNSGYWHPECEHARLLWHKEAESGDEYGRWDFSRGRADDKSLPPQFLPDGTDTEALTKPNP